MPRQFVTALTDALLAEPEVSLVGVYLHGSAVLGGYTHRGSDIDVLVVIAESADPPLRNRLAERLLATAKRSPDLALELSVITAATAAELGDCPFEVHLAVNPDETRVVVGSDEGGDPDLILYAEVCRRHGSAVWGPPASEVFAPVPHSRLLRAVREEVRWGRDHGHLSYAVLNACRALRFATDGVLCSKLDGGEWMLARTPEDPVIEQALADQRAGVVRPMTAAAARFVGQVLAELPASPPSGNRLVLVCGEEGAGKSTIIRALLPHTPDSARIDAEDIGATNPCRMDDEFFALLRRNVAGLVNGFWGAGYVNVIAGSFLRSYADYLAFRQLLAPYDAIFLVELLVANDIRNHRRDTRAKQTSQQWRDLVDLIPEDQTIRQATAADYRYLGVDTSALDVAETVHRIRQAIPEVYGRGQLPAERR